MADGFPLVGRARERGLAVAALEVTAAGRGQAVLVEGEPGIGKSRLVSECLREIDPCYRILRGSALELESDLPFRALAEAFELRPGSADPTRAGITAMLASRDTVGHGEARLRHQVIDALVELVESEASRTPVVVVVEDLQWADRGTVAVLGRLVRRFPHLAVGLLCTSRPLPRSRDLGLLVDEIGAVGLRLRLSGLTDADVGDLAAGILGVPPDPQVLGALRRAGGNPLFVIELLSQIRAQEALFGSAAVEASAELASSLSDTIRRRLSAHSPACIEILRLASILGSTFAIDELGAVAAKPAVALMPMVDEAVAAGTLESAGRHVRFRHDVIRDVLYSDTPDAIRAGLHAAVARSLAEAGYPAPTVAAHVLRGPTGRPEEVEWLRQAARDLAGTAPDVAAKFLDQAAAMAPPTYPERAALEIEHAHLLAMVGRPAKAEAVARRLLRPGVGASIEFEAWTVLVTAQTLLGRRNRTDLEALERAARSGRLDGVPRARLLAEAALGWGRQGLDAFRALALAREALNEGRFLDDDVAQYQAHLAMAVAIIWTSDDVTAGLADCRQALEIANRSSEPSLQIQKFAAVHLLVGAMARSGGAQEEGLDLLRSALRESERLGVAWAPPLLHLGLGAMAELFGNWDDAIAEYESAAAASEEGGLPVILPELLLRVVPLLLYRGDVPAAQRWLSRFESACAVIPSFGQVYVSVAKAYVWEATGESGQAFALLHEALRGLEDVRRFALSCEFAPAYLRMALSVGRTEEAKAAITDDSATWPEEPPQASAKTRLALAVAGDDLDGAVEVLGQIGSSFSSALVGEWFELVGTMLALAGRAEDAVPVLTEAVRRWDAYGAELARARTEARLRALGVRRGVRGPRSRPSTGWESLTSTEEAVVELVAQGLLYREVADRLFMSRRTVETHMAHILVKLGLSSRRDVVTAFATHHPAAVESL